MESLDRAPFIGQVDARGRKLLVARAVLEMVIGAGLRAHVLLAAPLLVRFLRRPRFDSTVQGTGIKVLDHDSDIESWATAIAGAPWRRPGDGFRIVAVEPSTRGTPEAVAAGASLADYVSALGLRVSCFIEPLDEELLFFGQESGRRVFDHVVQALAAG